MKIFNVLFNQPDWKQAMSWYEQAACMSEVDEDGTYDGTMYDPKYQILAKMAEMCRSGEHGLRKDPTKAGLNILGPFPRDPIP